MRHDDDVTVGEVGPLPDFHCPHCDMVLDGAIAFCRDGEIRLPLPGDLSVCMWCSGIGAFREDGTLRSATTEECDRIPREVRQQIAEMLGMDKKPS